MKLLTGADYSWDRPDIDCLWNQGVRFLCRYGSNDPSKNLSKSELDKILSRGMSVCVVYQYSKTQMAGGYSAGQADAHAGDSFVSGLGMAGLPLYFPCDQDYEAMPSSAKGSADAYFDGAKSVIGLGRTGGYGDDTFCKRMFDTGRIKYGWQTYAWSEGMWESRCQLRQVKNDVMVCGGAIDWDEAHADDFGQYPRPAGIGVPESEEDMTPAVAYDRDNKQCRAYRGSDGNIYYTGPEMDWNWIQIGATAKSGVGLAIRPSDGTTVISYINGAGHYCLYTRNAGSADWIWSDCGGQA